MKLNNFAFKTLVLLLALFKFLFLLEIFSIGINPAFAQGANSSFRKVENKAFTVGEWLRFNISYGFIHAGTAVMAIPEYQYINGRQCYHVKTEAFSAAAFNWIFKVQDRYETVIDVEGFFPWRFEQHISEGNYKADHITEFDQVNHTAVNDEGKFTVPEYVHDILSAFYFVRTQDFSGARLGQKIHLENFFKDKVYPLDVKFLGRQRVDVDAGEFDCIIVEPLVKEGGLFKHKGRLIVWLTDDARKIPVKVTSEIVVGSITIELEAYAGINGNIDAKK